MRRRHFSCIDASGCEIVPMDLTDAQRKLMADLRMVGHGWLYVANNGHSLADLVLLHHLGLAEVDRELSDGSICAHLTDAGRAALQQV
jgi:hypothetical protein